jgi:hypothetical protein
MVPRNFRMPALALVAMAIAAIPAYVVAAPPLQTAFQWTTVVNNGDLIPGSAKNFNSYNQPSVNAAGRVVIRARGKGPGEPPHGIYIRDMGGVPGEIVRIVDRTSPVPYPNNLGTTFIEFPSFPRIDISSGTFAFRGNSQPVWTYTLPDGSESRAGTSGIFANPKGTLLTGAGKFGAVPGFSFLAVPGVVPATPFDVFPGAPSVTDGSTIAFKGNYTVSEGGQPVGKTGVFFRDLKAAPAGGGLPVQLIANTTDTLIPGMGKGARILFGSTSPPSAANREVVFAGFDNEENPAAGGIYLAPLVPRPHLTPLVRIGSRVPGIGGGPGRDVFNRLGEGVSFDGQFVAFWGAWGADTRQVTVECPKEGNKYRREFCLLGSPLASPDLDPAIAANHTGLYEFPVPVNQGFFVHDTFNDDTWLVARTGTGFEDFLFWNFSGKVPGMGEGGEGDDDGEPARWRSATFVAVSGERGNRFKVAFKAAKGDGTVGIYMAGMSARSLIPPAIVIDTNTDGSVLDPEAPPGLTITEMGIERDGFRNGWLAVNARMGSEETGWAGIYVTKVR